jgi:hypothetical protein
MGEKILAQGGNDPPARKRRIERAPAKGDEAQKGRKRAAGPAPQRGRPALPAEEGKRYPLGIRTTKALRDALLTASRASGRSLAQEIEFRLERSLLEVNVAEMLEAQLHEFHKKLDQMVSDARARYQEERSLSERKA